jgi:hypothetical protein
MEDDMDQKNEQHELIQVIKELAVELGRTPTKVEFKRHHRGGTYRMEKLFGTYTTFVQAAGLDTYDDRRCGPAPGSQKLDNSIWTRDLEKELQEYRPRPMESREPYRRTVFIPDTHHPFACQRTLEFIYRFIERFQPEEVIQVGDLYDRYAHSRFPRSQNVYTPEQEDELARKGAESMWREVQKSAPKAKCTQLLGNHDLRPLKQVLATYPQMERWAEKMLLESMTFEGVETIADHREEYRLPGGVDVIHGHFGRLGQHRDYSLTNVVHGHDHKLGVAYRTVRGMDLWEMSTGFAGDIESKVFSYTPTKSHNCQKGLGALDEDGPRTIALR